jgi:hypothetical protein
MRARVNLAGSTMAFSLIPAAPSRSIRVRAVRSPTHEGTHVADVTTGVRTASVKVRADLRGGARTSEPGHVWTPNQQTPPAVVVAPGPSRKPPLEYKGGRSESLIPYAASTWTGADYIEADLHQSFSPRMWPVWRAVSRPLCAVERPGPQLGGQVRSWAATSWSRFRSSSYPCSFGSSLSRQHRTPSADEAPSSDRLERSLKVSATGQRLGSNRSGHRCLFGFVSRFADSPPT